MKYKEIGIISFVLFLCFSFLIQQNQINHYENNNKNHISKTSLPSTSDVFNLEWNITWGGSSSEMGKGIAIDGSGYAFITGSTERYGPNSDVFLLKYDSDGNMLWNTTWGGSYSDKGYGIALDSSDNVFITGSTLSYGEGSYDIFLLKYNSEGSLQWYTTWGGSDSEEGNGIAIDSSGNMFITGSTRSFGEGNNDVLILKYNSYGNLQWSKTWGGSLYDYGEGIAIDSSGNVFITGITESFGDDEGDVILLKYDSKGNLQWSRTWGNYLHDIGFGLAVDGSGNALITGHTDNGAEGHVFLLKYDLDGNLLWNKTWGKSTWDRGYAIVVDDSGNAFITGHSFVNRFLLKYDSEGNLQWIITQGGSYSDEGEGISLDSFGNIFIASYIKNSDPTHTTDVIFLKYQVDTDEDGLNDEVEIKIYGTNSNNSDSDEDGLSDWDEINIYLTDPNDLDSDDDGLIDGDEINNYGTDPNDPDSDDDGLSDREELNLGTDPLNFIDNWLSRGLLILTIIISSTITLRVCFIKIKKKRLKQINIILEKGDNLKEKSFIDKSGEYYQKALLKTNGIIKFLPKSMENIIKAKFDEILKIQIEYLLEGIIKLKEIRKFDESSINFNIALSKVNKISDNELKEKLHSNLKDYIDAPKIKKIKNLIVNLSRNNHSFKASEIIEKCEEDEGIIIFTIKDMILNKEIFAEYFKRSKAIVLKKQINLKEIDKLIKSIEDWEKELEKSEIINFHKKENTLLSNVINGIKTKFKKN